MKSIGLILLTASLAICGCGGEKREAQITIAEDGQPARTISIIVEGKDDVIIEDPYIAEIEAISAEYMKERERIKTEGDEMSREERQAFGDLRKSSGKRIRELQRLRRDFIREQMTEHGGVRFILTDSEDAEDGMNEALKTTGDYLQGLQERQ